MSGVKAKQVFGYILLPGVIPRARKLFASGFGYIAFLIANIYSSVRLLPRNHPYLQPGNIGKFGIRHVIGAAANNLVFKKENADQIIVFAAILIGIVLLFSQFAMLIFMITFKPAMAGVVSYFYTRDPRLGAPATDIAFILLDQVFGVPFIFRTIGGTPTAFGATLPWPYHSALHEMFRFYSIGLLIIGMLVFLYFVMVVVAETAMTGHPFGQRFQNVWVPIRLVVAIGLLLPMNYGLNSGQYIVLYAAKFGSGFATNAWNVYNARIQAGGTRYNPSGERLTLLAKPQTPSAASLVQAISIIHACAYTYWKYGDPGNTNLPWPPDPAFTPVKPYLAKQVYPWMTDTRTFADVDAGVPYIDALDFYEKGDIVIVFGERDTGKYPESPGNVFPRCGSIRIPITYLRNIGAGVGGIGGADQMQEFYYELVKDLWYNHPEIRMGSQRTAELGLDVGESLQCGAVGAGAPPSLCGFASLPACPGPCIARNAGVNGGACFEPCGSEYPSVTYKQKIINDVFGLIDLEVANAWTQYNNNGTDYQITDKVLDYGWAGAGVWYNKIADINGSFVTAVNNVPVVQKYPYVMELVREQRLKKNPSLPLIQQFEPKLGGEGAIVIATDDHAIEVAKSMNNVFTWWNEGETDPTTDKQVSGGIFENIMNLVFGTSGLFAMRGENASVHPLAQLTALGKGLVDSAIANVGYSVAVGGLGGLITIFDKLTGAVAEATASIAMSTAFIGLTAGFVLYYVLPFLPFLYFFFAVGTWVKGIFEAMVGVPLWALAHLRLDGEGLPGDSASGGYFLVFEIFIRPILTVFGLIAAMLILTAQVRMLNVLWDLVVSNLTGFEENPAMKGIGYKDKPRHTIDEFFFTVIYATIVYMMATASFKLIDKIPDNILRFMGAGVSSFSDINPDPTEGLTRYAAIGGMTVTQQMTQGLEGFSKGVGGALAKEISGATSAFSKGP